ncbi:MAG: ribose-5-phosphate isomerase RpiA [Spirochaetaceae bacterium]|nr:ribose-5-phosphate isomerase RpiA [Spirochaetaceae bacterium]MBQ8385174.1 ribose-5-phosphate isomerase RpiA [Spirochaetaceae bacterium]
MAELSQAEQKKLVGSYAVDRLVEEGLIFSGMKIGLGTGSTAMPAVERLAHHLQEGKLKDIKAVSTSFQTSIACEGLGIPVYSMNAGVIGGQLDLAIDGADEISPENHLIKGGGAALLLEKIVAYSARQFVVVADSSKDVAHLGTGFALPVEIIAEARCGLVRQLEALGASCTLREGLRKAGPVVTDNGNLILDLLWKAPVDAAAMEDKIKALVGVVEVGFFTKNKPRCYIARSDGSVMVR